MDFLIKRLETGKESAHEMRNILQKLQGSSSSSSPSLDVIDHHDDQHHDHDHQENLYLKELNDNSMVALTAFDDALSLLGRYDFVRDIINNNNNNKKRAKVSRTDINDSPHPCNIPKNGIPTSKDRRGRYNRRKNCQQETRETQDLTDDGFAWRKYGQKVILNSLHPRNYYRCTHKHDQGCQATKQVQQISTNPTKYRIIYHGQHTCRTPFKNNQTILLDSHDDDNPNSSILLSFETGKQALVNPFMFPSSSSSSSSSSGVPCPMIGPIKEEINGLEPSHHTFLHGIHNKHYSSPSSDYVSPSPDVTGTTTTGLSDQGDVISSTEFYSSTTSPHGMEEADYSSILDDDLIDLDSMIFSLIPT